MAHVEQKTAWTRNLAAPIRRYLYAESGAAVAIALAAAAALLWANLPTPGHYESFWGTELAISVGDHAIRTDLRGWVNEGLMTLFFLVVGLEAKRELDLGELRVRRRLTTPVVAAAGGMAAAAGVYLAITAGHPGSNGWGAAVSTDTALALGVLTLVTSGRAVRLRVFLLTVVVVDDLLSLLIIAFFYTKEIDVLALAIAIGLFAMLFALRWVPDTWRTPVVALVAVGIWLALFESGIDPVIAGLAIGLVTSAYPPSREGLERTTELARSFREQPTPELAYSARSSLTQAISANERLQYRLHPWTSRVIVPLFALANAGLEINATLLGDAMRSRVTLGIIAAYAIGKPLGVFVSAWLSARPWLRGRPPIVTWPVLFGGAQALGMGFTVSLLVADRAFTGATLDHAKIGILLTPAISSVLAFVTFQAVQHLPDELRARQLSRRDEQLVDLSEDVDPARDHIRGDPDGAVTLVEYGDFECPYCGQAEPSVRELLRTRGEGLRYVWRHLPLGDVHPHAHTAAEASEAAGAQGRFWEMHDRMLDHQDQLTEADLLRHAEELGLDVERFAQDLRSMRFDDRVEEDITSADESGVSGTPTFFVNGRRHYGAYDLDSLTAAVSTTAGPPVPVGSR